MLSKAKKEKLVGELSAIVQTYPGIVFTDFSGLKTPEIDELKESLRASNARYKVIKKSLLPFVSKKTGVDLNLENHTGSLAIAYGQDEGVAIAKIIGTFAKSREKLIILGGLLNRVFASAEKIRELALLPSREELLGKLVYLLSPTQSLVRVLASPMHGFLNVISKIKK